MMQHWPPHDPTLRPRSHRMQRRTLLQLGIASGVALAVAGGGLALWTPGLKDGKLSAPAREVFTAVAQAVLDGLLPPPGPARDQALAVWLQRLDGTIAGFGAATRAELSQLLAVLCAAPGRRWLAGLAPPWREATTAQVQAALQDMRASNTALRQQGYQALRDLTNAAYFADPTAWSAVGYPGPRDL
jgi:hypothetical protein